MMADINNNSIGINLNSDYQIISEDYVLKYEGFIYIDGFQNGYDSCKRFLELLETNDLNKCISQLKGAFFISLLNKRNNQVFNFIDNSGLYKAYYSKSLINTSFLDLIKKGSFNMSDIDNNNLLEFVCLGNIYLDNTFMKNVKKISSNQILLVDGNVIKVIEKKLSPNNMKSFEEFYEFFYNLIKSIENEKISIDITGGSDSRLIISMFEYFGADYDIAISGIPGNLDIKIADKISSLLGKEVNTYFHTGELSEETLKTIFDITDAQFDALSYHRLYGYQKSRSERKISVALSGQGGELLKDFWWYQDYPLIDFKKPNISKLYSLRIHPFAPALKILSEKHKGSYHELKKNRLKFLNKYIEESTTKTYDNIYFRYKLSEFVSSYIKSNAQILKSYAPLSELSVVEYGKNIITKQRRFNNFQKKIITKNNPELANISTTNLYSLSNKPKYFLKNSSLYCVDKGFRLLNKISQKILNHSFYIESANNAKIIQDFKKTKLFDQLTNVLLDNNIIASPKGLSEVSHRDLGRFITLALFLKEL